MSGVKSSSPAVYDAHEARGLRPLSSASLRRMFSRMSTLARWAVSPSLSAITRTSSATAARPSREKCDHAAGAQKIVGRKSAGKAGRAAGRQHVRRAGRVIAHRHRAVIAQKHRAGMANLCQQAPRRRRVAMCKCSGAISSASAAASSASATRIKAPNCSRLCRARSPRSRCASLPLEFRGRGVEHRFAPGDQDAGARAHVRPGRSDRRP